MNQRISKILSANDLGKTGSHQAGFVIPKNREILDFFPKLNVKTKNPRAKIIFKSLNGTGLWQLSFIYYNNKFFGGTRNEYRLTAMTKLFKLSDAQIGDTVELQRNSNGLTIEILRTSNQSLSEISDTIASKWIVVDLL